MYFSNNVDENYFMMHLYDSLKKRGSTLKNRKYFKITILLQGDKFFPNAPEHDAFMKKTLMDNYPEIKVVYNSSVTGLNYKKRRATINGVSTPFQAFYQYMPMKTPNLLKKSKIDPFDVDKMTLKHNEYSNISIIGNNLKESTFSFYSMNYRINAITQNVIASLLGSRKVSLFEGNSIAPLFIN